jgi:MFS family permease
MGIERTIVPLLAVDAFDVASVSVIMAFVVSFGFVKALLNLSGGILSDRWGRKKILILGWLVALPIPWILIYASAWEWIVLGNILLGVNQGLTWSMTVTAQMDLTKAGERGLVTGFNEFSGYSGVALGSLLSAYIAAQFGLRPLPFYVGFVIIVSALLVAVFLVKETQHYTFDARTTQATRPRGTEHEGFLAVMKVTWSNKTLVAVAQAGHVEKYVDALVWVAFPLLFRSWGLSIVEIGLITSAYGFTWGLLQLVTGPLSDRVGRKWLITVGMWLCAFGIILVISVPPGLSGWLISAVIVGVGMAFLYPTLLAAVGDVSGPRWRGTALGVYRFWRDTGYGVGAVWIGVISDWFSLTWGFYCTAFLVFLSGTIVAIRMTDRV